MVTRKANVPFPGDVQIDCLSLVVNHLVLFDGALFQKVLECSNELKVPFLISQRTEAPNCA